MNSPLKVGVGATGDVRRATELEQLPIDSIWCGGHVASPNGSPEAMMSLARLAELTSRVKIGPAILLLPLYTPAIVAKQIADLDRATGGRIILGIGVGGEYPVEFDACQVPVNQRGARTNEAIPLIRQLWTGGPVTHTGRYYPMNDVRIFPAPVQPGGPPIVVSGRSEAAMKRAALMGDGWMPYLYSARRYAESVQKVKEFAAAAGRPLDGFEWMAYLFTAIEDDTEVALGKAAEFLGGTYQQDFKQFVDRVAVAGTVERVTERLQEFVDAGMRHPIFLVADRERPVEKAAMIVNEIVPQLRIPE